MDVRDRAILLLLAVYGLRSIEVRMLKLDDIFDGLWAFDRRSSGGCGHGW